MLHCQTQVSVETALPSPERRTLRVFLNSHGSRGDVQPFIALGAELNARGHAVTICAPVHCEAAARAAGLNYEYMTDDFGRLVESDTARAAFGGAAAPAPPGPVGRVRHACLLAAEQTAAERAMVEDSWDGARGARPDVIVAHPACFWAPHFAERLQVPLVVAAPHPAVVATSEWPSPAARLRLPETLARSLGPCYNRLTFAACDAAAWLHARPFVREWRAEVGLPPDPPAGGRTAGVGTAALVLHLHSPAVAPPPADWPPEARVTGYWWQPRPADWVPPPALANFLAVGPPPVYVGFGSMAGSGGDGGGRGAGHDAGRAAAAVIRALAAVGVRGVLARGWGGLAPEGADGDEALPPWIHIIDEAPHDWLLPRCAAVVHHGGAGTTGAAVRAGRASVVVPFLPEHTFWAARLQRLGVAPAAVPRAELTADRLADALAGVLRDGEMRARAEALGARVRSEAGAAKAAELVERAGDQARRAHKLVAGSAGGSGVDASVAAGGGAGGGKEPYRVSGLGPAGVAEAANADVAPVPRLVRHVGGRYSDDWDLPTREGQ